MLLDQISLRGGIQVFFTKFILSSIDLLIFLGIYIFSFEKNPSIFCLICFLFSVFSMPQVFEQSLFLIIEKQVVLLKNLTSMVLFKKYLTVSNALKKSFKGALSTFLE